MGAVHLGVILLILGEAGCPQNQLLIAAAQNLTASTARLANPDIWRPVAQRQQIHESPDEGSHEDDAGSEVLWQRLPSSKKW